MTTIYYCMMVMLDNNECHILWRGVWNNPVALVHVFESMFFNLKK